MRTRSLIFEQKRRLARRTGGQLSTWRVTRRWCWGGPTPVTRQWRCWKLPHSRRVRAPPALTAGWLLAGAVLALLLARAAAAALLAASTVPPAPPPSQTVRGSRLRPLTSLSRAQRPSGHPQARPRAQAAEPTSSPTRALRRPLTLTRRMASRSSLSSRTHRRTAARGAHLAAEDRREAGGG